MQLLMLSLGLSSSLVNVDGGSSIFSSGITTSGMLLSCNKLRRPSFGLGCINSKPSHHNTSLHSNLPSSSPASERRT